MKPSLSSLGLLAAALIGPLGQPAGAQVRKCIDASGKTAYQAAPCPADTRSAPVDLKGLSAVPSVPANATRAEARKLVYGSCMDAMGRHANPVVRKLVSERPQKAQDYCGCASDLVVADMRSLTELSARNDQAGLQRMGEQAGVACAGRLR